MKKPFMKFYTGDWQSDEKLRMCSIAARGLWLEMLCIMHRATPHGHLCVAGESLSTDQLSFLTAVPVDQLPNLIGELQKKDVFSRTRKGVIYSRKMVRDDQKSRINAENGKLGGASKHKKVNGNSAVGKRKSSESSSKILAPEARGHIPKIQSRQEDGEEKPPPWFAGDVIKLNKRDYDAWLKRYGGTDEQFFKWLSERDDWLATQPPEHRKRWFISTAKCIENLENA